MWNIGEVPRPKVIANYNKFMNGVDRSDQILTTNSVLRKSMKWWKTSFYHLTDMAEVNGIILFKERQAQFPDDNALKRPSNYSLADFREEIVHRRIPRKCFVVRYREGWGDLSVLSYCNALQCQKYMHVSKVWDCFAVFHSMKYHR